MYSSLTGNTLPGTSILEAPSKYRSNVSICSVALMRITRRSDRRFSKSRTKIMLKSASLSRSCTSSKTTCVMLSSSVSCSIRLRKTPNVVKTNLAFGAFPPKGTWYPTSTPSGWQRSWAIRSASVVAASFRGCITRIRALGQESKMSCGTWVDLPQPVSPTSRHTWLSRIFSMMSCRCLKPGSSSRFSRNFSYAGLALLFSMVCSMTSSDIASLPDGSLPSSFLT
mmetsp:Transcript_68485/g.191914  ORF Transcript_68485/g.191914 Transcript_68485/m.191914 type:complete len:225 (+) Transcript_68485:2003-2677(+)